MSENVNFQRMNDKLFILIHSLSKQEKRYFKLFAKANRNASNYVRLFDAIQKQKVYNEASIKEVFKTETFIKQLHVTKNHLYTLILKMLHSYHADMSADSQTKILLHYVEILYKKGLYEQCKKILKQATNIAVAYEYHLTLLEIIEWQAILAFITTKSDDIEHYVIDGYNKESEFIKILKNKSDFRKLFYEILILNNKGTPIRSKDDLEKYKKIVNNSLLKNVELATSYNSKVMFYYVMAYYTLNKGNLKESNYYNKETVALMEANPVQIKDFPINYVAALNNLIYAGIQLKDYNISMNAIKKMRSVPEKYKLSKDLTPDLNKKIFIRSNFLELELYKNSGEFKKALHLISEIENTVESLNKNDVSRYTLFLYFNIAFTYFAVEDFSKARHWINKILNITETKEPVDIFCFARILNLLIHYELKNTQLIDYIYNSNIRFFNKRNRLYKLETLIFDFVKHKMLKETSKKKLIKDFKSLKKELIKITVSPQDKKALQYFDYISWVDSKIKNVRLADIILSQK